MNASGVIRADVPCRLRAILYNQASTACTLSARANSPRCSRECRHTGRTLRNVEPNTSVSANVGETGWRRSIRSRALQSFDSRQSPLRLAAPGAIDQLRSSACSHRRGDRAAATSLIYFAGWYSPNRLRMTSAISPTVAIALTAPTIGGNRFAVPCAASSSALSARVCSAALRFARSAATRWHCSRSSCGIDLRDRHRLLLLEHELVDADDDPLLRFDRALVLVRAALDLFLRDSRCSIARHHAAELRRSRRGTPARASRSRRSAPRPRSCRRADR